MDFELMFTSLPKLLSATIITLKLLSVSLFFGLFIGLLFAILRLNKNFLVNKFAYGYSYVFRGTPLLVQIFIIYFGLGQIEYLRSTFLWVILKEPYWCAIIAFALNTGAYTSEILRSAFQTIKPGIIEAGQSLGISSKIIFYKIQIPIAIRQSLPAYGNEIILMMKGTSLASTVTIMDLTGVDVNYPASLIMHEQNSYDPRIRTVPFHKSLYDAGRFGRKTRHGNYKYDAEGNMVDVESPDYQTSLQKAPKVIIGENAEIFSDILAGSAMALIDDGESPIVAALFGEDCSSFAHRTGLDYRRIVAIDTTGDLSKRVTLMTAPGATKSIIDSVVALINENGRAVTVIKDSPGFISQRIRAMIGNLGCEMAQIELATPDDIDLAMRLGLNYPMGPLEIIDDFGTELAHKIMSIMQEITGDDRYRPSPWLRRRALLGLGAHVLP